MCRQYPHAADKKPAAKGLGWGKTTALIVVLLAVIAPVLISEVIGGWTRKFTSPIRFSPSSIGNLTGKVALVTGANTGIGYHTALEMARKGAHVIVAARNIQRGQAAVTNLQKEIRKTNKEEPKLTFLQLDLSSLDSVEQFANNFLELNIPLHMLVLNAGVMKSPGAEFVGQTMQYGFETTQDGFEYHIGVNHIAHVYLTQLLADKLKESVPSRVVAVSSLAEQGAPEAGFVFDQWVPVNGHMPAEYEDGKAYGQSKLANLMFARELAERWNGTGVSAYALHPGVIESELARYLDPILEENINAKSLVEQYISRFFEALFSAAFMKVEDGALTQLHLATAHPASLVNGAFYHPIGKVTVPYHRQGTNTTLQKTLWEETEAAIQMRRNYRN